MFTLTEKSIENIEKIVGVSIEKISLMESESIDIYIEKKIGKKLKVKNQSDPHLIGRGSVLINMGRLMQPDDMEKKISEIAR